MRAHKRSTFPVFHIHGNGKIMAAGKQCLEVEGGPSFTSCEAYISDQLSKVMGTRPCQLPNDGACFVQVERSSGELQPSPPLAQRLIDTERNHLQSVLLTLQALCRKEVHDKKGTRISRDISQK